MQAESGPVPFSGGKLPARSTRRPAAGSVRGAVRRVPDLLALVRREAGG